VAGADDHDIKLLHSSAHGLGTVGDNVAWRAAQSPVCARDVEIISSALANPDCCLIQTFSYVPPHEGTVTPHAR
jgi:hypothetical protein